MSDADYELRFIRAGIDELESYLTTKEIYRLIDVQSKPGAPPYPQFTLGWLLLFMLRAQAAAESAAQKAELQKLEARIDAIHSQWRTAWSNKAALELRARLNLWSDFLEEYRVKPQNNIDRYPYEVTRRVLIQLLAAEVSELPETEQNALGGMDVFLTAVFTPGDFVWDPVYKASFPKSSYWYLYGTLRDDLRAG